MKCPECANELENLIECNNCGWHAERDSQKHNQADSNDKDQSSDETMSSSNPTEKDTVSTKLTDSKAKLVATSTEGNIFQIDKLILALTDQIAKANQGKDKDTNDQVSLFDLTTILPPKDNKIELIPSTILLLNDLEQILKKLQNENIALISCFHEEIALAVAYAVIERLNISKDEGKRLLDFEKKSLENIELNTLNIDNFSRKQNVAKTQTVIVVDGIKERAKVFLDSLFVDSHLTANRITQELKINKILLLCLVDPRYIKETVVWQNF